MFFYNFPESTPSFSRDERAPRKGEPYIDERSGGVKRKRKKRLAKKYVIQAKKNLGFLP
jgi:hypothetical protein